MQLCLGTVQLGLDYGVQGDTKPDEHVALELISAASEYAIAVLDTANAYGVAEQILGAYIKNSNIENRFRIVSKMKPSLLDNVDEDKYEKTILQALSETFQLLNIKKIDGYLFHDSEYAFDSKKLAALSGIKSSGLASNVGISIYTPKQAMAAAQSNFVDYIQVPYNALDHRLDSIDFFKTAKNNHKTIFARSAFLQGLLTMHTDALPPYARHAKESVRKFQQICHHYGLTPLEGCLTFVKDNIFIDYCVFGVANITQLHEIVTFFNNRQSAPNGFMEEIRGTFSEIEESIINPSLWMR